MKRNASPGVDAYDQQLATLSARLAVGEPVHFEDPSGIRFHVDRPLPFLCVYREPPQRVDLGTGDMVLGEASFLAATSAVQGKRNVTRLIETLASAMRQRFGGFLVVEIWSAQLAEVRAAGDESDLEPTELRPCFRILGCGPHAPLRTMESLQRRLERISYMRQRAEATVSVVSAAHPPDLPPLWGMKRQRDLGCDMVGLEVRPIYRDGVTGDLFPHVLRTLRQGVGRALKQALFTFSKTRTNAPPEHFYSLGRRAQVQGVRTVDRQLSAVSDSFQFLLQVTPVNGEAAWREFRRGRFETEPRFYYRPLNLEISDLKRRLFRAPVECIEDPTLAELFRQRQDELDRKITMLADVGTPRFRLGSEQIYGRVTDKLLAAAEGLLEKLPLYCNVERRARLVESSEFASRAEQEMAFYRQQCPGFSSRVVLRDDLFAGLLCSGGNLIIGQNARTPENRVEALLQHEVGTHLVTFYNGLQQPFQILHSGLAGYEALQEGLAVLSEYLVGGLSSPRMRLLAARVVAAKILEDGGGFLETFRRLDRDYAFDQRTAYTITMRTFRGGGLTKDAIYLRGLIEVLHYLRQGGELAPLFVGKIATEHIEFVRELQLRNVLKPPELLPRYFDLPGVAERLLALRAGASLLDLVQETEA